MSRVLHGMPLESLPNPGELQAGDQIVAYREDTGKAYRSSIQGLEEDADKNISDLFSRGTSYSVGDYCIYDGALYKCTSNHLGEWNANDFKQVTIADEISNKIVIRSFLTGGNQVRANTYETFTDTFDSIDGYTPYLMDITINNGSYAAYGIIYGVSISGNVLSFGIRNVGSSYSLTAYVQYSILYIKN